MLSAIRFQLPRLATAAVFVLAAPTAADASTFAVNTTADAVDALPGDGFCATSGGVCSIRAAIMEANALGGADVVSIPPGTFVLSIPGQDEDDAATGDLDIRDDLALVGAGAQLTRLDGAGLDFVLAVVGAGTVSIADLALRNGLAGIHLDDEFGTVAIRDAIIEHNSGDGVFGMAFGLDIARTTIQLNQGAGVYLFFARQPVHIDDSLVSDNHGDFAGGGLSLSYGFSDAIVRNSVVSGNSPGGISVQELDLILEDSLIQGNTAGAGVELANENAARIERTTIAGNDGPEAGGLSLPSSGGGGYPVLVLDSAIVENSSSAGAGGIKTARQFSEGLELVNTTVSGNNGTEGGGIVAKDLCGAGVSLLNCTVTKNFAGRGGGIAMPAIPASTCVAPVSLSNTILAGNTTSTSGPDCIRDGPRAMELVSLGYNLIGNTSQCAFTPTTGDLVAPPPLVIDPFLEPLDSDAIPTPVHRPRDGSPVIDAADPTSGPTTDQLGMTRPLDGDADGVARSDIGAVERTPGDSDLDSLADGADNCPTVANGAQGDIDADGVGDACDNCTGIANPRVGPGYFNSTWDAGPWATLTGGQRDDDHDGFGNRCDAKFPGTPGLIIGALDLAQFRASTGKSRADDTCGSSGVLPCAIFDLSETSLAIGAPDLDLFRSMSGLAPGPKCPTCPLYCRAGADGSCF